MMAGNSLQAQQVQTPPSRVNVKFNAKYPQQAGKASWKKGNEGYTATFKEKGRQTVSNFTETGQWISSETQLMEGDWKPVMRQYVNQNHEGYRYLQGYRFEDPKGTRYQLDVQDKSGSRFRLDFDQEGNFVNERPLQE